MFRGGLNTSKLSENARNRRFVLQKHLIMYLARLSIQAVPVPQDFSSDWQWDQFQVNCYIPAAELIYYKHKQSDWTFDSWWSFSRFPDFQYYNEQQQVKAT